MSTMPSDSPKFTSPLAARLEQFLAQKHAMGYRYEEGAARCAGWIASSILAYRRKIL